MTAPVADPARQKLDDQFATPGDCKAACVALIPDGEQLTRRMFISGNPPGHNADIVGDEPYVGIEFTSAAVYGVAAS